MEKNQGNEIFEKNLRLLFIGNSHTYNNDLPLLVQNLAKKDGYDSEVTMIAHGGWYLSQHEREPDVRFNILHGHYDYVILQEHAHPFGPVSDFLEAVQKLNVWIREAQSTPVIFSCWARESEKEAQDQMNQAHEEAAKSIDALLAPVGEGWWDYKNDHPELSMYANDGAHASPLGSSFAAGCIWDTIQKDLEAKKGQEA